MLVYRDNITDCISDIAEICREEGWCVYSDNIGGLHTAFGSSLYSLGCFDDDRLVGYIRCVGDGVHIVFIADLIIRRGYRRRGIGVALMKAVFDKYSDVRTIYLLTDTEDEISNAFYRAVGMKPLCERGLTGYTK